MAEYTEGTLAHKLYAMTYASDWDHDKLHAATHAPFAHGSLTTRELDLLDWGAYVGIAYAIARLEGPFVTVEDAATRAVVAAQEICAKNCDPIAPPADVDELVRAVVRAYEAYDGRHLHEPITSELQGAIVDLMNQIAVTV